jgi:hypothetical protein
LQVKELKIQLRRNEKMDKEQRVNDPQEIEIETEGAEIEIEPKEEKDARGGNHNPTGANQYTSGRNDDRGRKK